jgi:mono/diheme cytochrome c family protein
MKGRRLFVAGATIVVLALVATYGGRAAHAWQSRLDPVLARGAKLAAIGGCISCHTAPDGQPFAGGLPLQTPYGVIYSTNITPDPDTGIGRWSLDAFTRAMRHGVSRDGHLLYPAFPYPDFTRMSDADIASLYAWSMSREPINAHAPKNELRFPLGFRPIMAAWNLLYLHPGPDEASSTNAADPEIARGRYLVDSVGHCGACHTPLDRLGAEQRDSALQGGTKEGWDAPALTNLSTRPKPWTQAQLASYLRTGFASEHGASAGPMRPVTRLLADASAEDVQAMAAYLIALPSNAQATPGDAAAASMDSASSASSASSSSSNLSNASISHVNVAAQPGNGTSLFVAACASCHGDSAPMSGGPGHPSLSLGTAINADSPRNMVRIILDGIDWDDSASAQFMPPFAGTFTDTQIAELANYTRTRFTARGPWPSLDADAVARLRKESPQR